MDETFERQRLLELDLTTDVIEMIIEKKRQMFLKKQSKLDTIPTADPPVVEELEEVYEPTFYPPLQIIEPEIITPKPVLPEPPMVRDIESVVVIRRKLPWQKK